MNEIQTCSPAALEAYIRGELDEAACEAVERHAMACEACRTKLEAAFAPEVDRVKRVATIEPIPASLAHRLTPPDRKNRGWVRMGLTLAGAAAAFALWYLYWPVSLTIGEVTGVAFRDGVLLRSGDSLKIGDVVVMAEGAALPSSVVKLQAEPNWGVFRVSRSGWSRALEIEACGGTVSFDSKPRSVFRASSGGISAIPLGAKFGFDFASTTSPTLSTYKGLVKLQRGEETELCSQGQSRIGLQLAYISNDPTVRSRGSLSLPWSETEPIVMPEPSAELKAALSNLSRSLKAPERWIDLATTLAAEEDWIGVGRALEGLHAIDPAFRSIPPGLKRQFTWGLFAEGEGTRIASELTKRLREQGEIDTATAGQLEIWLDRDDVRFERERTRALEGMVSNPAAEPFARAIAAFRVGRRLQNDPRWFEESIRRFSTLLSRSASGRTIAKIRYSRGEAKFFMYEHRRASLIDQREAVREWPKADWLVNVGVRIGEIIGPGEECLRLITEGLKRNPSYANYERTVAYLEMSARTEEDHEKALFFALQTKSEFRAVAQAHIRFAGMLLNRYERQARSEFDNAMAIYEVAPREIPTSSRVVNAGLIRRERGPRHKWTEEEAKRVAEETGLTDRGLEYVLAEFYVGVGQPRLALPLLRSISNDSATPKVLLGRALQETGEFRKAAMTFQAILERPPHQVEPLDHAEAWIRLAECQAQFDPIRAKTTANALLTGKIPDLDSGWRQYRNFESRYRARACAVLGLYSEAASLQSAYLESWPWNPDRLEEERRRDEWRALASAKAKDEAFDGLSVGLFPVKTMRNVRQDGRSVGKGLVDQFLGAMPLFRAHAA